MKDKRISRDLRLILALLAAALILFAATSLLRKDGEAVEVRIGNELYASLPLSKDTELDIDGLCILKIEDGKASVTSAVCKNQICVKHRPISRSGEAIICLPNGVTVKVVGKSGADFVI